MASLDDDGGAGTGDVGRTAALANGWFDLVDLAPAEWTDETVSLRGRRLGTGRACEASDGAEDDWDN